MKAHLVEPSPNVDGRLLNDVVDDLGKRVQEVGGIDLRVEEDLGGKEALVADVNGVFLRGVSTGRTNAESGSWCR